MREMKDSGVEWLGEIPAHWKMERLQWHISEIKESNKPEKSRQVLSLTNKRGVIPYEEKGAQGNVAKEDYSQYKLAYPGTIVANSMNILIGSVGRCDYFGCVSPVYYVYKPNDCENLEFINYMFQMEQFQKELRRYANGILEIRLRVSSDGILKREMAFPPIDEQARIVSFLNQKCAQIDTLIANVQAQIEKLKAYKQSLITEVVTKGLDSSAPMKDSGVDWIGAIPAAWEILKFKYIATVKSNLVEPSQYLDYPQVSPENIEKNSGRLLPCRTVEEVGVESNNHLFFEGQIIYSKVRPILNKVTIAPFDGLCSADMYPIETAINKKYLVYLMLSNVFLTQVKLVTENRVKMPKINQEEISRIVVCCPPSKQQEDIALFLDKKCSQIDRLIAIKQAKTEKLEQYKRSLIYEYVTGKKEVPAQN